MASRTAFSLVELSIVLVILGLLTGGILTGQSLIRAAELRSISTDIERTRTAVFSFRDRYQALPGDMKNAVAFWGEAAAPASCATTQGTGVQTCNGDGDSWIETTGSVTGGTSNEMFRFWQHLANAGLVEGSFTGIQGLGGVAHAVGGSNVLKLKPNNLIMMVRNIGVDATYYAIFHNANLLFLGAQTATSWPSSSGLKPEEAWNIDQKTDDGKPGQGTLGAYIDSGSCLTADNNSAADYNLTETSNACGIIVRLQ